MFEFFAQLGVAGEVGGGIAGIAVDAQFLVLLDGTEEREIEALGGHLRATAAEQIAAHVFDDAEDGRAQLLEHLGGADGIIERHLLRCGDNHRAGDRQQLAERE